MSQAFSGRQQALSEQECAALRARNTKELENAAALLNEAAALCPADRKDDAAIPLDPVLREKYIDLQQKSLAMLYASACGEELLWYEDRGPDAEPAEAGLNDLCRPLRSFLNHVDTLTGDYLAVGDHSIPGWLYSPVPPERLTFVLLHELLLLWRSRPDANTIEFFADKKDNGISIDMILRHDPAPECIPLPAPTAAPTDTEQQADALISRFTALYRVQLMQRNTADSAGISMLLPAGHMLDPRLELHSDGGFRLNEKRNICHAVLSNLIPTETLLWGDALID